MRSAGPNLPVHTMCVLSPISSTPRRPIGAVYPDHTRSSHWWQRLRGLVLGIVKVGDWDNGIVTTKRPSGEDMWFASPTRVSGQATCLPIVGVDSACKLLYPPQNQGDVISDCAAGFVCVPSKGTAVGVCRPRKHLDEPCAGPVECGEMDATCVAGKCVSSVK